MITCKHCSAEKSEDQMKLRGGKPSKVCLECDEKAANERARIRQIAINARAEMTRAQSKRKAGGRRKRQPPPHEAEPLEIEVPGGGHGFKAALTDENTLLITQANPQAAEDNVVLTRAEAKQIFATFGKWAGLDA